MPRSAFQLPEGPSPRTPSQASDNLNLMQARAYYIDPTAYTQALEMAGEGH